ncbi:MAG: thioredoxin family protein [Capsulimonas sp.]|uniref:cytochrome c biogenesis protein CcdA n=1 Tax=Capsulimonas sp. TaxID=2494211 RepID=UPI003262FAE8
MKRTSLALIFALLSFFAVSLAPGARAGTPTPIHFTATVSPSPVHAGEVATVTVKAVVDPGWHVYSVTPAVDGPAVTDILSLTGSVSAGPTTEDTVIRKFDANFGREVGYHENAATFQRQFRVGSDPIASPSVTLHYQTCNDKVCLPPTDVTLPVTLTVAAGTVRPEFATAKVIAAPPAIAAAATAVKASSTGLGLFLLAALGAGLLALITPCVFPLIPITLTNFVKQADGDKGKLVRLSSGYALGIVALYVALGAIVTATVGATGINKIAANPWVNLGIFVVFVVFALSFFETIQLTLPANLGAMQNTARKHGGVTGLALLGITFVLASFTCTAPFLGTLLVAAAGGERFRPLLGMLVFAFAFVSPFLIFAAFPQWIGKIPKSGVWLARVKATLGFVELAAALKFLSNADQVWQWKLLTEPVLLAAWSLIFFCAALYLWGTLRFGIVAETEPHGAKVPLARGAFALLFLVLAGYCFKGLAGRPVALFSAFLPPSGYGMKNGAASEDGLTWLTNYDVALAQAKAEGKPLFIDFTGVTCTNCRQNEKNVFPLADVRKELGNYVRVQLYTDRPGDAANQKLQLTKFGDVALPLYGVVDPQTGNVIDKTAGTIIDTGAFTQFLSRSRMAIAAPSATAPAVAAAPAWAPYTPESAAAATQAGKPTIVDFTAAWCVNCKEIEHDVFEHPDVAPALGRNFTTLRADLTKWNDPANVALQKQYGFASLPTIVFLDPSGKEIKSLRITGRLSVAEFQKRMQTAAPAAAVSVARG